MEWNIFVTLGVVALWSIIGIYYIFVRKNSQTQNPVKPD